MDRETFDKLLDALRKDVTDYCVGLHLLEENDFIYENEIDFYQESYDITDHDRWTVSKEAVFCIENTFYIKVSWDSPSTEMQEGQCTNCEISEVFPIQYTATKFIDEREKENEK